VILSEAKIIMQSQEYGHTLEEEFEILLIHSLLHLLGFDHEEEEDFHDMWKYEGELRDSF
jgi:probable rRNA maturation factor